ncbi:hypothetical protein F0562_013578 [Nyssa sinensis]|uniref:Uncharacterized protein n=1 Tax=Nyssa sinensis TaxID=561372 RepID=A0A5J4ZPA8_9ASTE|nr:hypothetical protein F0562_013578 [Nyssa sinensis]
MPLPWKKAKFTRVSQFVADHLHSQKRGGSLVVQTGFPTSLIDLFVKNRDRLKKAPKRKQFEAAADPLPISPLRPSNSPAVSPLRSLDSPVVSPLQPSDSPTSSPSPSIPVAEFTNPQWSPPIQIGNGIVARDFNRPTVVLGGDTVQGGGEVADAKGILMTVLKLSLLVILALGTKKLAVGITMSAFLLIFMDYVGKHAWRLLKSCAKSQESLESLIPRVLCFLRVKQDKLIMEEDVIVSKAPIERHTGVSRCSVVVEGGGLNAPMDEFQIVQPHWNLLAPNEEIQRVKDEFKIKGGNKSRGCEVLDTKKAVMGREDLDTNNGSMEMVEDYRGDALETKDRRSRRAMMKSKIKKLVPKKFRNLKKKGSSSMGDDKVIMGENQEQEEGDKSTSLLSSRYVEQDADDAISSFGELLQPEVEAIVIREEMGRETERNSETQRNSRHLILFLIVLIVLVGLVGGRVFAFGLTFSWCLMLKPGGTLRGFLKVPSIRSTVSSFMIITFWKTIPVTTSFQDELDFDFDFGFGYSSLNLSLILDFCGGAIWTIFSLYLQNFLTILELIRRANRLGSHF